MTEELFIPPELRVPKPWFTTRPDEELVKVILKFILSTGNPHQWPGQTYDKPRKDSRIAYLSEFHLPDSKPLVPCPCCTPRHPKYRHGMIVWFPDEHVIRIIGHDCFNSINSEEHIAALKLYHAEIKRKQAAAYLLSHLDKVPELIAIIEHAAPVGHAIDTIRHQARAIFKEILWVDLWDLIKTGELTTKRKMTIQTNRPGREDNEREIGIIEVYGRIAGYNFLRPRHYRLGLKLDNALTALGQLEFGADFRTILDEMSDKDRFEAARLLGKTADAITTVFKDIEDMRQFTSPVTLATLNGWSRDLNAPVRMHIGFDGNNLNIGKSQHESRRIPVPAEYHRVLRRLPKFTATTMAA